MCCAPAGASGAPGQRRSCWWLRPAIFSGFAVGGVLMSPLPFNVVAAFTEAHRVPDEGGSRRPWRVCLDYR